MSCEERMKGKEFDCPSGYRAQNLVVGCAGRHLKISLHCCENQPVSSRRRPSSPGRWPAYPSCSITPGQNSSYIQKRIIKFPLCHMLPQMGRLTLTSLSKAGTTALPGSPRGCEAVKPPKLLPKNTLKSTPKSGSCPTCALLCGHKVYLFQNPFTPEHSKRMN